MSEESNLCALWAWLPVARVSRLTVACSVGVVCMCTHGPHGDGGPYRGAKYDPPHESATGRYAIGDMPPWLSERFLLAWRWSARVSLSTGLARVTSTVVPSISIPEGRRRYRNRRRTMPTCCDTHRKRCRSQYTSWTLQICFHNVTLCGFSTFILMSLQEIHAKYIKLTT